VQSEQQCRINIPETNKVTQLYSRCFHPPLCVCTFLVFTCFAVLSGYSLTVLAQSPWGFSFTPEYESQTAHQATPLPGGGFDFQGGPGYAPNPVPQPYDSAADATRRMTEDAARRMTEDAARRMTEDAARRMTEDAARRTAVSSGIDSSPSAIDSSRSADRQRKSARKRNARRSAAERKEWIKNVNEHERKALRILDERLRKTANRTASKTEQPSSSPDYTQGRGYDWPPDQVKDGLKPVNELLDKRLTDDERKIADAIIREWIDKLRKDGQDILNGLGRPWNIPGGPREQRRRDEMIDARYSALEAAKRGDLDQVLRDLAREYVDLANRLRQGAGPGGGPVATDLRKYGDPALVDLWWGPETIGDSLFRAGAPEHLNTIDKIADSLANKLKL